MIDKILSYFDLNKRFPKNRFCITLSDQDVKLVKENATKWHMLPEEFIHTCVRMRLHNVIVTKWGSVIDMENMTISEYLDKLLHEDS
jgi:hypothetical protein